MHFKYFSYIYRMTVRFYFAFIAVPAGFFSWDFYFVHVYFFTIMVYYFSLESVTELEEVRKPWASLVAQMVKNLPAMQKTWVQPLGQEDPLEKGTVTHASILAWRNAWTEEPGGLQSTGSQKV